MKSVLTLGTFDGVHRGHQRILRRVAKRAKALGASPIALAFTMPPRHAGVPRPKPVLLTTYQEKLALLRRFGIRKVKPLIFNRQTANTTAEDFFHHVMMGRLFAKEIVVGPRLAFGKNRAGRLPLLKKLGKEAGVRIHVMAAVPSVSSRRIRALLDQGKIEAANRLLGYAYGAKGKVVHGNGRGRRLGFPTANLDIPVDKILPPGVSIVRLRPGGWKGLCNVGIRPTFTPQEPHRHCEVFLLEGPKRLYGKVLQIEFLKHLRPERRFATPAALQRQMNIDLHKAKLFRI